MRELLQRLPFATRGYKLLKKIRAYKSYLIKNKSIKRARIALTSKGYEIENFLGFGKDGIVFTSKFGNDSCVIKYLSDYARLYLPMTSYFISRRISHPLLYNVSLDGESVLKYPYEKLFEVNTSAASLLRSFIDICDLEIELVKNNLVNWDFGFSAPNYMTTESGQLRWIDYGGNGFLYISVPSGADKIASSRKCLVVANNNFIQLSILLHLSYFGIGHQPLLKWILLFQDSPECFEELGALLKSLLHKKLVPGLYDFVMSQDFLTIEGWSNMQTFLANALSTKVDKRLEEADIASLNFLDSKVEVRGYQNYDVSRNEVMPLSKGHSWAVTKRKHDLIDQVLGRIVSDVSTYLDIGSNLGIYVFTAKVKYALKATGYDYNEDYIESCKKINQYLSLDCDFQIENFSEIDRKFDVVTALGLIHHLYHRTEAYGSLDPILRDLSNITLKYCVIEFPTENDPKAAKWTGMPFRSAQEPYSLRNFHKHAKKYFKNIQMIGEVVPFRPVYLLSR